MADDMSKIFNVVFLVLIVTSLASTIFATVATLNGTSGVPTWVNAIYPIVLGIVFLGWVMGRKLLK